MKQATYSATAIGCVIMASGNSSRFGSNKLMENFAGAPLISHILRLTSNALFSQRIVVTRHPEVAELCRSLQVPVLLHDFPDRNDTVRLGLSTLLAHAAEQNRPLSGCLFAVGDQPLLSEESLQAMLSAFCQSTKKEQIFRLCYQEIPGNPVLFPSVYFDELLHLPPKKGGGILLNKYSEHVIPVYAHSPEELADIDTRQDFSRLLSEYHAQR